MPITIDRDRLSLPPSELVSHPVIQDAIEAYERARQAGYAAQRELTVLDQTRDDAVARDMKAYADALERNPRAKDPGTPHADAHDAKIKGERRHVRALAEVESRRLDALEEAIERHGDEWAASVERDKADALRAYMTVLDALDASFATLTQARTLAHYLNPREGRPARWGNGGGGHVELSRSSESERSVSELIGALRTLGQQRAGPTARIGTLRAAEDLTAA